MVTIGMPKKAPRMPMLRLRRWASSISRLRASMLCRVRLTSASLVWCSPSRRRICPSRLARAVRALATRAPVALRTLATSVSSVGAALFVEVGRATRAEEPASQALGAVRQVGAGQGVAGDGGGFVGGGGLEGGEGRRQLRLGDLGAVVGVGCDGMTHCVTKDSRRGGHDDGSSAGGDAAIIAAPSPAVAAKQRRPIRFRGAARRASQAATGSKPGEKKRRRPCWAPICACQARFSSGGRQARDRMRSLNGAM